ncbi:hypothetical protein Poly51_54160 [Rubripirellula tenax]|uniref:Uncharacterized protein n=1 Tax=Rubripirellula tenax TaxID=2528015 RepID=A0A5C6EGP8_9BACT|nr:hypothetical protein [Rubripirellula tenax]TWU47615.1 hypothetical protein Poly51_54160 [Rubripirellula tenax]
MRPCEIPCFTGFDADSSLAACNGPGSAKCSTMEYFSIHPDDARWLARWLRNNACGVVVLVALWAAIAHDPPTPASWVGTASATSDTSISSDGERVGVPSTIVSHQPVGWRRTATGWEDSSKWAPLPRPLGQWIAAQQDREPLWAARILATLRDTPPLIFALFQITAITAVVAFTERRKQTA